MKNRPILWIGLIVYLVLSQSLLLAQQVTVITVTGMDYTSDIYKDTIIPLFEAEHPNIQVEFVPSQSGYFGNPLFDDESGENTYYEEMAKYVSSADVLYVSDSTLSPFATSTGYFLDLMPLISADETIMPDDFYPAAWNAFQSDGGIWGLPYTLEVQLLVYNKDKFDNANFAYPDGNWRIEDYIQAAEALQSLNDKGEVELSPLNALNPVLLFHDQIGKLYNEATLPAQPDFTSPELIHILDAYAEYYKNYEFAEFNGYSYDELPMSVNFPYQLFSGFSSGGDNSTWEVSLLPGNLAGSRVEGFAISSGTLHPEAAYEFASFMTRNVDIFAYSFTASPARRSMEGMEPEDTGYFSQNEVSPELEAMLNEAREVAIPASELRYYEAFYQVRSLMDDENLDAQTALQTIEEKIVALLEESQSHQSDQIIVAEPKLRPELAPNEIVLHFGMNIQQNVNDRQELWDSVIDEFVASQPGIGAIDMDYQIYGQNGMDEDIDCWYNGFGGSFSSMSEPPEGYLALDPLLNADPNFDPNSFLPGVLAGAQVQGLTYGYPITLQPMMMSISVAKFEEAGLPIPDGSWTVNDFTNAIVSLASLRSDPDMPIVRTNTYSSAWMLMLLAAYGGRPIDFNTDPATYNLTDPQNLAAMQQLISYINDGLIEYSGLRERGNFMMGGAPENDFIVVDLMGNFNAPMQMMDSSSDIETRVVTFPDGEYMPVAFSSGMIHINSESLNVEPCYDWVQTIATHPELFHGMPARQSQFNDPALIAQEGEDVVSFYEEFLSSLSAPNIMALPDVYGSVPGTSQGAWLEPNFFYQALDNVILHDADLEEEMAQAEANIAMFRECTVGIEEISQNELSHLFEEDQEAGIKYYRQFIDCAISILPALRDDYSYFYQDS